jgi:3-deoxy-D-manno-octulosonic-acid transferase
MAMAGWDVTSRGAEATDRIVTLIRNRLDEAGL